MYCANRILAALIFMAAFVVAGEKLSPSPTGSGRQTSPADGTLVENVVDVDSVIVNGIPVDIPWVKKFTLDGQTWDWDPVNENYLAPNGDTIDMGTPDQYGVTPYTYTDNAGGGVNNHSSVLAPQ